MAWKFQCKNCSADITVGPLTAGEGVECKNCGTTNFVPKSAERISNETARGLPIVKALSIIGTLSIGFGIIVGIVLLISFSQSVEFPLMDSRAELTLIEVAVAFGATLFYCAYGLLFLGIAKIIELLSK